MRERNSIQISGENSEQPSVICVCSQCVCVNNHKHHTMSQQQKNVILLLKDERGDLSWKTYRSFADEVTVPLRLINGFK